MKKMKNIWLLLTCMLSVYLVSCSGDDGDDTPPATETEFKTSADNGGLTFAKSGGTADLHVQANGTVEVTSNQTWCKVVQTTTASTRLLKYTVTVESNTETNDRSATITVKAGTQTKNVDVFQTAADGLIVSTPSFDVKAEGETITVKYATNGEPDVTIDVDWIKQSVNGRANMQDKTLKFDVKGNYTEERTGKITFTLNNLTETVTVKQKAMDLSGTNMASDALVLAAKMYAGINIGNMLEVPVSQGGEGGWTNGVKVNEAYVKGIKAAGFNAVRIPCAWDSYIEDQSTYKIKDSWLNRVNEVVGYCVANDLYAIVNIHWDGGWIEDHIFDGNKEEITKKYKAIWTQIANKLNHYDEHLLFAGANELGMNETNSGGKKWDATAIETMVAYEQAFIDAVRATGGNNAVRCLVVQGPGTDITSTSDWYKTLPKDNVENRMMVEVHFYEPYQFVMMENDADWGNTFWYWGKQNHVSGSTHNPTWGEEDHVLAQFGKMKSQFIANGIPVVLGEYSVMARTVEENQAAHDASRAYWNEVVTREAKNHGLIPFHWDTGSVIDRNNGEVKDKIVMDAITKGAQEGKYPF